MPVLMTDSEVSNELHTGVFRKQITLLRRRLGLLDSTTDKMRENGTVAVYDPLARCHYTLHRNGYIRRLWYRSYPRDGRKYTHTDALNPKVKCLHQSSRNGAWFEGTTAKMLNADELLIHLEQRVLNYRNDINLDSDPKMPKA